MNLTYDIVAYWDVTAEDLDQRPHRDFMDVLKDHIHKILNVIRASNRQNVSESEVIYVRRSLDSVISS